MKFTKDPHYEAAFVRVANYDEPTPEELEVAQRRRTLRIRLAVVAGALVAIACTAFVVQQLRRDTPAKQVERGIAFGKSNDHVAAVIEFKRSLQEIPDQPAVRVMLGNELSLLSDAKGAEIEFQKAADAGYQLESTIPLLATAMLHQGKFEKVIELVNGTRIDLPDANAELLAIRGSAYYALDREAEAMASWNAALDFVPAHPATLIAKARARAAKGAFADADQVLDGIGNGSDGSGAPQVEILALRGEIARATGRITDAVADYEAALAIEPTNLLVRTNLAEGLVELARYDEASVEIKKVVAPMPSYAPAQFVLALIGLGQQNYVAANDAITNAVQLAPTEGRYQLLAGALALQLGHTVAAEQYLNAAILLMPGSADARRLMAMIYVERNETAKAEQLFGPVFASARKSQEVAKIASRIAMQQGNTTKAASAFDQVDPTDPKNVDATLLSAALKIKTGDKAGGFARLRAASSASPNNADVDAAIVMSHLTYNEIDDAFAQWKVLARKEPNTARTTNLMAAIDLARGDKPAARRAMDQAAQLDPAYLAPVSGLAMLDLGDRKVEDAKARLKRFVAANPGNSDAILLLIKVEQGSGASSDVILGLLRDAHRVSAQSEEIAYTLATFLASRGDFKEARTVADEGLKGSPDDVQLLKFVGDQALAAGDNDTAIAIFTKLKDKDGASAEYPTRIGVAHVRSGRYEEALTDFRLALSRNPDGVDRQFAMVSSLLAAGRGDEGRRILFEISRLAPKSTAIPELDADVKLQLKQYPEAVAAYRKAIAQQPSSRLAIKTYNALTVARLRGEANSFMNDWLKGHPKDDAVRRVDADVALRANDFARAAADFRILAAAHPTDPFLLNNLAYSLSRINDPEAIPVAERASKLAPDNAAIADTLGWMLVEKGDARGLGLIAQASKAAPGELDIRLHLGRAQLKQGDHGAARSTLQALVTTAPDSEQAKASKALLATF